MSSANIQSSLFQDLKNAEGRLNMTIEERVSVLETQVSEIEEDVTALEEETADQEVRIVAAEENIQCELFIKHL